MAAKQSTPLWFWEESPQKGQQQDIGFTMHSGKSNVSYNSKDRELNVTFPSGSQYVYYGVSPQRFTAFRDTAGSRGSYFSHNIRDEYVHRRL